MLILQGAQVCRVVRMVGGLLGYVSHEQCLDVESITDRCLLCVPCCLTNKFSHSRGKDNSLYTPCPASAFPTLDPLVIL